MTVKAVGGNLYSLFDSALNRVARMQKIKLEGTEVTATVHFGKVEDGGFGIAATLDVLVKGVDKDTAEKLVEGGSSMPVLSGNTWQL